MNDVRLVYSFPRDKPFGLDAAFEHVERYRDALATALRAEYPAWNVEVVILDTGLGDVELEPEASVSEDERLRIAVAAKHLGHRLAERMLAEEIAERPELEG